jgi:uncharacterized phage protein (TIGR01671 family)
MGIEKKFRAWDNGSKKFWYFDLNNSCNFTPDDLKRAEQFTGLKDSKGKEIYEGDIIKHIDAWGRKEVDHIVGTVVFGASSYSRHCQGADEIQEYYGWLIKTSFGYQPLVECSTQEVAGNIYENPEINK